MDTRFPWSDLAQLAIKAADETKSALVFTCYRPVETLRNSDGTSTTYQERMYSVYSNGKVEMAFKNGSVRSLSLPSTTTPDKRESELREKYPEDFFALDHFPTEEEVASMWTVKRREDAKSKFTKYLSQADTILSTAVSEYGIKKSAWTQAKDILTRALVKGFNSDVCPSDYSKKYRATDFTALNFKKLWPQVCPSPTEEQKEIHAKILPLIDKLLDLKDKVYTGRAPEAGPTKKELRLRKSNVGHCGICGRDIMLGKSGKTISQHGYSIPWQGGRTRHCFGSGYEPIETGTASLEGYLKELDKMEAFLPVRIATLKDWLENNPVRHSLTVEDQKKNYAQNKLRSDKRNELNHCVRTLSDLPEIRSEVQKEIEAWSAGQVKTIERYVWA